VSNIGFYWAMSDYTDATMALDWFSGNFTSLTGSVQYNWLKQFMKGSVNFREFWKDEGGTNWALDTNHDWRIDERTSFRASARVTSDNSNSFIRRNSFDPMLPSLFLRTSHCRKASSNNTSQEDGTRRRFTSARTNNSVTRGHGFSASGFRRAAIASAMA